MLALLTFLGLVLVIYVTDPFMFVVVFVAFFAGLLPELLFSGLLHLFALLVEKAPAWAKFLSLLMLFFGFLLDLLAT